MLSQRWPADYDGYLAGAAAVQCHEIVAALAPQARMVELGYAPPACELRELRRLAMEACDGLDGVEAEFVCDEAGGRRLQITEAGVVIAQLA